jgi:protein-tyrosine phosphatase
MLANLDKVVARLVVCHGRRELQRAELHFHLLPDVDDGPPDLDEAVELARLAVADGTSLVTVTPHVRDLLRQGILAEVPARVDEVAAELRRAGVPLELRAGAELAHDDVPLLGDGELEAIAQGPRGARWVLIEAPLFGGDLDGFLAATAEVRARGFGTLIGHPERCSVLMEDAEAVAAERRAGALMQVNGSSLLGRHGPAAQAWGLELLSSGRADLIASDAHRPTRPPVLSAALAAVVAAGLPRGDAEALVSAVPRTLLRHGIAPARGVRAA